MALGNAVQKLLGFQSVIFKLVTAAAASSIEMNS